MPVDGKIRDGWTGQETFQHLPSNRVRMQNLSIAGLNSAFIRSFSLCCPARFSKAFQAKAVLVTCVLLASIWIGSIAPM
jgi:hypothetical protein